MISLFIVELQEYLKCELMLAKPDTYVAAVLLAKLHEQKHATVQQVQKQSISKSLTYAESRRISYSTSSNKTFGIRLAMVNSQPTMSATPLQH